MAAVEGKLNSRTRWFAAAVATGFLAVLLPAAVASSRAVPDWAGLVLLAAILGAGSALAGHRAPSRAAALAFAVVSATTIVLLLAILISIRSRGGKVDTFLVTAALAVMVGIPAEIFSVVIAGIAHATPASRRRRAPPPGHCPQCGYDLGGVPGPCPECGA